MQWGGEIGYCRIVNAAVAANTMMAAWHYIRLADQESGDFAMNGDEALELLWLLEGLLRQGGVFHESATDLCTNKALRAIRGRAVLLGGGTGAEAAVALEWPSPESTVRMEPVRMAQE